MVIVLLQVFRIPRVGSGASALLVVWFYAAATSWEVSAVRASVMLTIVIGGWVAKRPSDLLNSLAAAALVILVADPREILQMGFQFSFLTMVVIGLLLPPLNVRLDALAQQWLGPDPLLPQELVPRWRQWLLAGGRETARFFGLSLAAWVGSLPLSAKYFHLFSPISTLANVIVVPFGAGALMANLGALFCGQWLPWGTEVFNSAAWSLMVATTWLSNRAAELPGAFYYVAEPSWLAIGLYYGVIVIAFGGWLKTNRNKIVAGIALGIVVVFGFCQWVWSRPQSDLTVLPLAGGHAVYVEGPGWGNDWLVNCGSRNAMQFTLKDYLRGQGVNWMPRLVLADGNARNCGGANMADELFGVGELWTSSSDFRSAAYREALAHFTNDRAPSRGNRHRVFLCGRTNGCWQALFPATNGLTKAGDGALVLRGNFQGTRILLLSELSRKGQSDLLALTSDLRAEIVVAGLPEEGEPLCKAVVDAVQPQAIVVADSEWPANRRADRHLKESLGIFSIPVVYTRTAGAVTVQANRTGWRIQTMDGQTFYGRQRLP